jgi:hypothetical protein
MEKSGPLDYPCLNMWASNRTIGTKDATISRQRSEFSFTTLALIEELADVTRHRFVFNVPAFRTSYSGYRDNALHAGILAQQHQQSCIAT